MTVIIDGTAGITFPVTAGSASAVQASSGRVLQVVNATYSTQTSTTSSTFSDTGLTASITPSSTTSKILVIANINGTLLGGSGTSGGGIKLNLLRSSTIISKMEELITYNASNTSNANGSSSIGYLDSPSTTSATSYKVQFAARVNASASVFVQYESSTSSMTLMEIAV